MQLDELKLMWEDMNKTMEDQKILTDKLIQDVTKERFKNRFQKIETYETIGAIICFATVFLIIINFKKLDTWYLDALGILTLILLITLPIITLKKIRDLKEIDLESQSYKDVLVKFQKSKKEFFIIQKINVFLSAILAISILPVFSKIFKDVNVFETLLMQSVMIYIPMLLVLLYFLVKWAFKGYKNLTMSAENILTELDS